MMDTNDQPAWQGLPEPLALGEQDRPAMAQDKLERLKRAVSEAPWSAAHWADYLSEATSRPDPALGREAFEAIVLRFPSCSRYWISYIEFEQKQRAFDNVDALFNRCLLMVVSVDLWRFYLNYIRKTHAAGSTSTPEQVAASRSTISKAFELTLANVGMDKDAGGIWTDYISFVKSTEAPTQYEEQMRMETLRRIYQKALAIPLNNIESIWKDYDSFENGLNKLTAKKLLTERSAAYMTARTAYREMKNFISSIDAAQRTWVATPPTWDQKELDLLEAWKSWIAWEKSNPLHLDETPAIVARVMFAYKSALLMMRFVPEIWHDAATYLLSIEKMDDAVMLLKQAVEIMPASFTLVELEEMRKTDYAQVSPVLDKLIDNLENKIVEVNKKFDAEREELLAAAETSQGNTVDWDGERREFEREKTREQEREVDIKVESRRREELRKFREALALTWVVYMRFSRRAQVCCG
ncbi:mRNA 3'-end-processing protein rna14 [Irineochytrium annulatum]|nr:mRNA 3'-end-processing protein rna14 [Irineochytrium annulatum]